jgi:hypothetical protein
VAVELGVPAAVLLCLLVVGVLLRARPWRMPAPDSVLAWSVLGAIALHSLLEYPLWYGPFQLAFGLAVGTLWAGDGTEPQARTGVRQVHWRGGLNLFAGAAFAAAAYAAWDYYRVSQLYLPSEQRLAMYRNDPMEHARASRLFRQQVRFAEYTLTPLTYGNAAQLHDMGLTLLHFSPEARVVEKLIESALLLGRDDEARFYLARYRIAYPRESARWLASQTAPASLGR